MTAYYQILNANGDTWIKMEGFDTKRKAIKHLRFIKKLFRGRITVILLECADNSEAALSEAFKKRFGGLFPHMTAKQKWIYNLHDLRLSNLIYLFDLEGAMEHHMTVNNRHIAFLKDLSLRATDNDAHISIPLAA